MRGMANDCNWIAEEYDDTLKQLFMADEALAHSDRAKAVAYLISQADHRIPAIENKAGAKAPEGMKRDLKELAQEISGGAEYRAVHDKVMEIDRRYAIEGYRAFARCYNESK